MDNNAVTEGINELDLSSEVPENETVAVEQAKDEDKELAALLTNRGWQRLAQEMQGDIDKFKTGAFIKKPEDKALEELGKLFVIHQSVATMLQKYLTKVEQAAKAVADAERRS